MAAPAEVALILREVSLSPDQRARIECFDVAHIQGAAPVASRVVFVDGVAERSQYRKFKVKTVGNDDYGAMKEVLVRRLQRYADSVGGELHDPSQIYVLPVEIFVISIVTILSSLLYIVLSVIILKSSA